MSKWRERFKRVASKLLEIVVLYLSSKGRKG